MKKKLLLAAVGVGVSIHAQDEATMNISAQVIKPLQVEITKHINFGKIIAGSSSAVDGEFKVTGNPGEKYIAYFKEFGQGQGQGQIEMVHEKDPSIKFPVTTLSDLTTFNPTISSKNGYNLHTVVVNMNVPPTQTPGNYTSKLTIAVRYE